MLALVAVDDALEARGVLDGESELDGLAAIAEVDDEVGSAPALAAVFVDVDAPAGVAGAFGLPALALGQHARVGGRGIELELRRQAHGGVFVAALRVCARRPAPSLFDHRSAAVR